MPKITAVEPQKSSYAQASKRRGIRRFNIYLDGTFAFGADEDLVVKYRLLPDKIIEHPLLDKLLFEAQVGKWMERMYQLFSFRPRSEKEIRDYFRIKNQSASPVPTGTGANRRTKVNKEEKISDLVIEAVIKHLQEKELLNDREFARLWVEARSKRKGRRVLKAELFRKGIDKEIIGEVIGKQITVEGEKGVAERVLENRIRFWKGLLSWEKKKKATEFLLRRGFEYEVVKEVVEKMIKIR